eukprot:TRINITY_DN4000_c0_g1_i1.p1 TRINITY_DN4000_c0_g1~~TRINITY_DN4000_c0_g1_i1.p1  ORF type:complete len:1038 (+),score=226.95 TRINITY_DN4000_c0_g1_i1:197-3115(+)
MSHRVKVLPGKTFRFNECVCNPYNADFDGDEMNVHVPQTQEARAEATELMTVVNNLATPKSGELLVCATQDFLTASYLLTSKDRFFDKAAMAQLCCHFSLAKEKVILPPPAVLKPLRLWTGKQVFSLPLRSAAIRRDVLINVRRPTKSSYTDSEEMCRRDGFLCIHNGELMAGQLEKAALGGGKNNVFGTLLRDYGSQIAADRMTKMARICARFIGDHGFSLGISDVTPSDHLQMRKAEILKNGDRDVDILIAKRRNDMLQPDPGMSKDETLEAKITNILSAIRDEAGKMCKEELPKHNAPLIMATCGSKGSTINISQMIALVGQQTLSGKRIGDGFIERSLPHFEKNSKTSHARGFCRNSFYSGLDPQEFFFHTQGGREGLVDTAVKTAETGYMQRRLVKGLEDLAVQYDGTVRSNGTIVQFTYGDDGIEPTYMEGDKAPVELAHLLTHILTMKPTIPNVISSELAQKKVLEFLQTKRVQSLPAYAPATEDNPEGSMHSRELKSFFLKPAENPDEQWLRDNRLSEEAIDEFLQSLWERMRRATAEPGTAVGALGAQSIGEPCTQMTLKTFHFAGVASMNITLGVPRIRELINGSTNINTPLITLNLVNPNDENLAKQVKGRVERVTLGDITREIREVYTPAAIKLHLYLSPERVRELRLDVDLQSGAKALLTSIVKDKAQKLKLSPKTARGADIVTFEASTNCIVVQIKPEAKMNAHYVMQKVKSRILKIVVGGVHSVNRCVIVSNKGEYELMLDGNGLLTVLGIEGVDQRTTSSNHVIEVNTVLGIEAARSKIIEQVGYTMDQHGVAVDQRHLQLLADLMTYKGEILGITRFGIAKMKDSILMLASFERTTDFLFDAAVNTITDNLKGVSESIIIGTDVPLGTGHFTVLPNLQNKDVPPVQSYSKVEVKDENSVSHLNKQLVDKEYLKFEKQLSELDSLFSKVTIQDVGSGMKMETEAYVGGDSMDEGYE